MSMHDVSQGADAVRGRSSSEIEHDLALIRGEIDGTLSALQDRLSPRQMLRRTRERGASALSHVDDAVRRYSLLCVAVAGLVGVVSGAVLTSSALRGKRTW